MKKAAVIAGLFILASLYGCQNQTNQKDADLKISDYFPFSPNVLYVYEGQGNEYASYTVYVDYIEGDKIQTRTDNGGTQLSKVLKNADGQITQIFTKEEAYYRENMLDKQGPSANILLKEPLVKGTSWTTAENNKRHITDVDVQLNTNMGNLKTIEVTTEGDSYKIMDYYAKDIGLVKSVFSSNGDEVSSTLIKMEQSKPLEQNVKFFYPNINDDKLYYTFNSLSFKTNDVTKDAFETAFKSAPNQNLGVLLSTNAKINSLYLDKDEIVHVDFNKEFVTQMNAGAGYEAMILQSITNTLGEYYGVNKVYITIEDEPYASGHIEMKEGEVFNVNLKNSVELKK